MKKVIMIYFILATLAFGDKNELIFKDVPPDHWAYSAIRNLVDEGVISENSFQFKGEEPVSRYTFAEDLNRAFEKLDEKKANRGDLVILESLVYEFSKELTRVGFDAEAFSGKIENMRTDIEFLRKKTEETDAVIEELRKRITVLEDKTGI